MVDMSNVWDRTSEFLGDNANALLPIVLIALLVPHSVSALVSGAAPPMNATLVTAIALICALVTLWGQLAVVALALDTDGGRSGAVGTATRSFGRTVAVMLILLAAVAIAAAPIIGVMAANGVDFSKLGSGNAALANLSAGTALFASLYGIAALIVILVVGVRLALVYPVIVAEGGVVAAIRRSWALSRGIVWKMIGVWLLFVIVYLVAAAAITSGIGTVIGLFANMQDPFSIGRIVVAILSGVVSTLFTLIVAAFSAKLYRAATAAREGVAAS